MRPTLLALDVVAVLAFVAIGRRSHVETGAVLGVVQTAAPFLLALAAAWIFSRAWQGPERLTTGLVVWLVTVVAGLALRRFAFAGGTATPFVAVAAVFLAITILGWRAVAAAIARKRITETT